MLTSIDLTSFSSLFVSVPRQIQDLDRCWREVLQIFFKQELSACRVAFFFAVLGMLEAKVLNRCKIFRHFLQLTKTAELPRPTSFQGASWFAVPFSAHILCNWRHLYKHFLWLERFIPANWANPKRRKI